MIPTLFNRSFGIGAILAILTSAAWAQIVPVPVPPNPTPTPRPTIGGVYVDPDGTVRYREVADAKLTQLRARARTAGQKDQPNSYISLPKLTAQVQQLTREGKPVPPEVRYLYGLTQVRYVFVYPQEHDLIIGGPAEPIDATNPASPVGKRTARPIMQLDDLVAAMRTVHVNSGAFGCSIDPSPDALQRAKEVAARMDGQSRDALVVAMTDALGPQSLSVFGVQPDTRLAMICIAADYKLKRLTLGIDPSPVAGVSHAIDNSRPAGNRFWFELDYRPLLTDADGNSFELRGQRLTLKCGALSFDEKGATATAKSFARNFSTKFPDLATMIPAFAELQNAADLSVLAALIRQDSLDQKAGWGTSWLLEETGYPLAKTNTPRSAQTLVCIRAGSLAAGGVTLSPGTVAAKSARQIDEKGALAKPRAEALGVARK